MPQDDPSTPNMGMESLSPRKCSHGHRGNRSRHWEVDIIVTKTRWEDLAQLGRVRFVTDPACKRLTERGVIL